MKTTRVPCRECGGVGWNVMLNPKSGEPYQEQCYQCLGFGWIEIPIEVSPTPPEVV